MMSREIGRNDERASRFVRRGAPDARYFRPLAKHPGAFRLVDDAAALAPPEGAISCSRPMASSAACIFPDDPADAVAKKALRVNLSDLAAKGARPLEFLFALALPQEMALRLPP